MLICAEAEIFPVRQLAHGLNITPAQCAALPLAVWVTAGNRNFCIRYYVSTVGGEGDMPIVWLSGDKLGARALPVFMRSSARLRSTTNRAPSTS